MHDINRYLVNPNWVISDDKEHACIFDIHDFCICDITEYEIIGGKNKNRYHVRYIDTSKNYFLYAESIEKASNLVDIKLKTLGVVYLTNKQTCLI